MLYLKGVNILIIQRIHTTQHQKINQLKMSEGMNWYFSKEYTQMFNRYMKKMLNIYNQQWNAGQNHN